MILELGRHDHEPRQASRVAGRRAAEPRPADGGESCRDGLAKRPGRDQRCAALYDFTIVAPESTCTVSFTHPFGPCPSSSRIVCCPALTW